MEFRELLKSLVIDFGTLREKYKKLVEMGNHEGFTIDEIDDMVRLELKGKITRQQMRYLFSPETWKEASKKQYKESKVVNINTNQLTNDIEQSSTNEININTKANVIDIETDPMRIKDLENKTTKEPIETLEVESTSKAAIETITSFIKEGFNPEEAVNIIKGNMKHIVQELINRTYTQKDEFILIIQKVNE
jgi:hypothetical protein